MKLLTQFGADSTAQNKYGSPLRDQTTDESFPLYCQIRLHKYLFEEYMVGQRHFLEIPSLFHLYSVDPMSAGKKNSKLICS